MIYIRVHLKMNIVEIKTFKFEELTEQAQQNAIEQFRNNDHLEYGWHDSIKEDFHSILGLIGFYNIESQFSGFWSQGDGASFIADYSYKKGCLKVIKEHAPLDNELYKIVEGIVYHQKDNGYLLTCNIYKNNHRYSYSNTMSFDWCKNGDSYFDWKNTHVEGEIEQLFKDLAEWYYKQLESEYNYLNSDESIKETLIVNEYDFLECGNQYY